MAHMANTVIALVGAFGFFLVFSCITSALVVKLEFRPRTPLSEIDRIDPSRRGQMERVTLLEGRPLLDRLLTPFLTDSGRTLASLTGRALENEEDRLRRAGFPYKTVGDYYAAKVLGMIALFVLGAIFIAVVLQSPQMAFVPLVLGLVGLFLPDWQIRQETKKRASTLQMEMAFTLDRIGLAMAGGSALLVALHEIASSGGGLFINELRAVCTQIDLGMHYADAFQQMLDRCPHLAHLARFVERCVLSLDVGFPITEALTGQGEMMREQVEGEMLAKGLQSTLAIVAVTGLFALPAIGIVVLGPAFFLAAGSGFL